MANPVKRDDSPPLVYRPPAEPARRNARRDTTTAKLKGIAKDSAKSSVRIPGKAIKSSARSSRNILPPAIEASLTAGKAGAKTVAGAYIDTKVPAPFNVAARAAMDVAIDRGIDEAKKHTKDTVDAVADKAEASAERSIKWGT